MSAKSIHYRGSDQLHAVLYVPDLIDEYKDGDLDDASPQRAVRRMNDMKIALTGTSSTGKTTLAKRLMKNHVFVGLVGEFVTEDARSLLRSLGHTSMDNMTRSELRKFQELYFAQKSANEAERMHFLVDRSFVDVAAYWLVRDSFDLPAALQEPFELQCRKLASKYDLHVYFPPGQIPFAPDGYRSEDLKFHQQIASTIQDLLRKWDINYISIDSADIDARVQQVLSAALAAVRDGGVNRT